MSPNWFENEDTGSNESMLSEQFKWIDHYPSPALLTDNFWIVIRVNSAFTGLTGLPAAQVTGRNISTLIPPDSIRPGVSPGDADNGICTITATGGRLISCGISKKAITLGNGSYRVVNLFPLAGLPAPGSETNLEEVQQALQESQDRLTHIQQISQTGSWDISFNGRNLNRTWNYFELLGLPPQGIEGGLETLDHSSIVHPDDSTAYKSIFSRLRSGRGAALSADYRIVDGKGKIRFIHHESKAEYNSQGALLRWSGTLQDITSHRRAENLRASAFQISQLSHSQHNLNPLMEAIHRIIATHMPAPGLILALSGDDENGITFPYCSEKVGEPGDEASGEGLIGYVMKSGEPLAVSEQGIALMIAEGLIQRPRRLPVSWLGIPLKTHDRVMGVICLQSFSPDITYGEDEKEILNFVSEQIALAIQRIRSDQALISAKNAAEDSSRLKSSLLANMSHELRTPMTGILGFSEILTEELEDARLKSMASTIFKSASRLMSTLNSIIDLSAIEADKNTLSLRPVNTRLLFQPLLKVAYSVASDKGLYLRTSLPPNLYVMADEKLLGQLLHHLIDNALKFTIDGGISVSAYTVDKNSNEVIIRVSDTGIGIAKEHHKLIFEEFRQVSEGFSRTFEGSGLGLSLCIKIARLLNARLWVESVQDKGSDFYVALPLTLPDVNEPALDSETAEIIRTHRLSRGPVPDVLIVEDNEVNRRLAALYLREICNTEMAENGYVAIEKIRRKKYDAILMDINLGAGPDGLSIAHKVKTFETNKNTPIIAVTGYTMHGDREKLLANGCTHYLPKPYDKKTLLRLFSGILYNTQTS